MAQVFWAPKSLYRPRAHWCQCFSNQKDSQLRYSCEFTAANGTGCIVCICIAAFSQFPGFQGLRWGRTEEAVWLPEPLDSPGEEKLGQRVASNKRTSVWLRENWYRNKLPVFHKASLWNFSAKAVESTICVCTPCGKRHEVWRLDVATNSLQLWGYYSSVILVVAIFPLFHPKTRFIVGVWDSVTAPLVCIIYGSVLDTSDQFFGIQDRPLYSVQLLFYSCPLPVKSDI